MDPILTDLTRESQQHSHSQQSYPKQFTKCIMNGRTYNLGKISGGKKDYINGFNSDSSESLKSPESSDDSITGTGKIMYFPGYDKDD